MGCLASFFKGETGLLVPFGALLDKVRPLVGKLPNKAMKLHQDWLVQKTRSAFIKEDCIDMNGIRFPLLDREDEDLLFKGIMFESLAPYLFFGDSYTDDVHGQRDGVLYGLVDDKVNVTVERGDVVIDAGAWIGDLAAYAAKRGATAYAFEPTPKTFGLLTKTAELNPGIIPINKGLSDKHEELDIFVNDHGNSGANTFRTGISGKSAGQISTTTLDDFVEEMRLERIDFIKSDIEGYERNLLRGAQKTLARFRPKLAICTYHLPDDPQVLEELIMTACPGYRVVHKKEILFADAR